MFGVGTEKVNGWMRWMDRKSLGDFVTVVGSKSRQIDRGDGRHRRCLDDREEGRGHTERHLK